jgi:hypothetical protein
LSSVTAVEAALCDHCVKSKTDYINWLISRAKSTILVIYLVKSDLNFILLDHIY